MNRVKAWKGLIDAPDWARLNSKLLEKLSGQTDEIIESAGKFFKNSHSFPANWKNNPDLKLPKTYQGSHGPITYNEYGFPKLESYSPGSQSYFKPSSPKKLVGDPRSTDNLEAMKWLKKESGLTDGVDFKQIGDGKGSVLFKVDGIWEKCSWHHHEDGQTLMPVLFDIHNSIAGKHTGGVSVITKYPELIGVFK